MRTLLLGIIITLAGIIIWLAMQLELHQHKVATLTLSLEMQNEAIEEMRAELAEETKLLSSYQQSLNKTYAQLGFLMALPECSDPAITEAFRIFNIKLKGLK